MIALVSGGCTVDALTWRGDLEGAVALAVRLLEYLWRAWSDYFLGGIWLVALALAALADQAQQDRLLGKDVSADAGTGARLLQRAVETAERGRPRGGRMGPEGRAWLARAHGGALPARRHERPGAVAARSRSSSFDSGGYRYEVARSRFRLAEALLRAATGTARSREAGTALIEAEAMGAVPLSDRGPRARAARAAGPAGRAGRQATAC